MKLVNVHKIVGVTQAGYESAADLMLGQIQSRPGPPLSWHKICGFDILKLPMSHAPICQSNIHYGENILGVDMRPLGCYQSSSSSSMTLISESFLPSFTACSFRLSTSSCCRFSASIFSFSLISALSMLALTSGRLGKCSLRSFASSSGSLSPSDRFFLKVANSLRSCMHAFLTSHCWKEKTCYCWQHRALCAQCIFKTCVPHRSPEMYNRCKIGFAGGFLAECVNDRCSRQHIPSAYD